jgi:hypothetical protein
MNEISDILKSMASHFADLADKIEKRDSEQQHRIGTLEAEVYKNKHTLKTVAKVILNELED